MSPQNPPHIRTSHSTHTLYQKSPTIRIHTQRSGALQSTSEKSPVPNVRFEDTHINQKSLTKELNNTRAHATQLSTSKHIREATCTHMYTPKNLYIYNRPTEEPYITQTHATQLSTPGHFEAHRRSHLSPHLHSERDLFT